MTKPKRYRRYSAEFKREAILRASEEGDTDTAVCEELGISTRQFRRWPGRSIIVVLTGRRGACKWPLSVTADALWYKGATGNGDHPRWSQARAPLGC